MELVRVIIVAMHLPCRVPPLTCPLLRKVFVVNQFVSLKLFPHVLGYNLGVIGHELVIARLVQIVSE